MNAFLVDGNLLPDKNKIREMWADHFESLGTPSDSSNFDNDFCHRVTTRVHDVLQTRIEDPSGALCESLEYEEVAHVWLRLKPGVANISIDYEHIRYAGPPPWKALFCLYRGFFESGSVCQILKTGIILPLFKRKGAKANNKDNYRGITLFPTISKISEMILVHRLEQFASQKGYFSQMQFGFQEGVGCVEASFIMLETISHMLEKGSEIFGCFLDVRKAFHTVWIDSLLFKLFTELRIEGGMWLAIKDLYTGFKAKVLYSGSLPR